MEEWLSRLCGRVAVTAVDTQACFAVAVLCGLRDGRKEALRAVTLRGLLSAGEVKLLREVAAGAPGLRTLRLSETGVDWNDLDTLLQRPMLSVCLHNEPLFRRDCEGWARLAGLQSLQSLALNGCGLTSAACGLLASVLDACPQLHALSLARNPLSSGLGSLLKPLNSLPLKSLSLANTQLSSSLAIGAVLRSVVFLDLANNALDDEFAVGLGKDCPRELESLVLCYNCISEVGVEAILRGAGSLQSLDISFNPVKQISVRAGLKLFRFRGAQDILLPPTEELDAAWSSVRCENTEAGSSLQSLNLTAARASAEVWACVSHAQRLQRVNFTSCMATRSVGEALAGKASLTHVRVGGNALGDEAVIEVIRAISASKGLKELDLSDNVFSGCGLQRLDHSEHLELLSLACNHLIDFLPLQKLLLTQRSLVELNLSRTKMNSEALAVVAEAMQSLPVRVFKVSGNDFSLRGSRSLKPLPSLREVDFARCQITPASLSWILSLLPSSLTHLDLFCNPLHAAEITLPADLLSLNLHKCQLCDSGLAQMNFPRSLRELRLGWNSLTAASMPAFAAVLIYLESLVFLSLFEALLDDERADRLVAALPRSLQRLDLGYTQLPASVLLNLLENVPPRLTWCNLVGQTFSTEVLSVLPRGSVPSFIVNE